MRASKENEAAEAVSPAGIHISGAEGIYNESEISKICAEFIDRAMNHSRGRPDKVVFTIEKIRERPKKTALLPVRTIECNSPGAAWELIVRHMLELGISSLALDAALKVLKSEKPMRGAALIAANSGQRLEPDSTRGIRVSRLGIDKVSDIKLSRRLSSMHINTTTVKEALVLASKVASCKDVFAEICVSDDPDYTTGYIASSSLGYLRITNIKEHGGMNGGRVFFARESADIKNIITCLERKPVIVEFGHE
jgi:6-carboxyhexanoate--CoA ligase